MTPQQTAEEIRQQCMRIAALAQLVTAEPQFSETEKTVAVADAFLIICTVIQLFTTLSPNPGTNVQVGHA